MCRLHFTDHELTQREPETPEKARNSESEEGEAVHPGSLPESLPEGDRDVLAPRDGRNSYAYGAPDTTYMTIPLE